MTSVNNCTLIGNLADAPTIRKAGEVEVASFSIATSHSWFSKTKQKENGETGDWESKTTWHRVTVWRPGKKLKEAGKGDRIYVRGRYESNQWEDKNGETRYSMELIAQDHWVVPKGGGSFQTEQETRTEPVQDSPDVPFPEIDEIPY